MIKLLTSSSVYNKKIFIINNICDEQDNKKYYFHL